MQQELTERQMLETPQIIRTAPQLAAAIHLCVPWGKMREVMGPGLAELRSTVAAQGVAVTGPWFTHHLRRPTDTFDFRICLPVAAPVTAAGRVEAHELPAATVARTVYRGPYDGLGAAWGEFQAWISTNGHKTGEDFWECYLSGPDAAPDPASYRTQLNRPLARETLG
jgi:effector-binding domain-containing protein